jgi:PAS domain S-box-containing protein
MQRAHESIRSIGLHLKNQTNEKLFLKLLESEHKYKNLVELSPEAISILINGKFEYVNPAAVKVYGATNAEELIGKPTTSLMFPEDIPIAKKRIALLEKGKKVPPIHFKLKRLDGKAIYAKSTSVSVKHNGQKAILTMVRDITERIENDRRLAAENHLYNLKNNSETIDEYLKKTTRYLLTLSGWKKAGLIIKGNEEKHIHLEGFTKKEEALIKRDKAVKIQGTILNISIAGHGQIKSLSKIIIASDKKRTITDSTVKLLQFLSQKISDAVVDYEQKAKIETNNQLLEKIFSTTNILIAYLDKHLNFIRVNRAYAEAEGKTPDYFKGKNHFNLYPYKNNAQTFKKILKSDKPYVAYNRPFEYKYHPERGTTYWNWIAQRVKNDKGEVTGLLLVFVDTTEYHRMEEKLIESYKHLGVINRQVSILLDLNKQSGGKQKHQIIDYILNSATDISGAKISNIYSFNPEEKVFNLLASSRISFPMERKKYTICLKKFPQLKRLVKEKTRFQSAFSDEIGEKLKINEKINYFIFLPLIANDEIKGAIMLGFTHKDSITTQELDFYEAFATQAAFIMNNIKVFDTQKKLT